MAVARGGLSALPAALTDAMQDLRSIPDDIADLHLEAVDKGHCGLVPRDRLGPMVSVQWARDAALAEGMLRGDAISGEGAILIAGGGHTRSDAGVPVHLRRAVPGASIVTIAFLEVPANERAEAAIKALSEAEPADFVWWTPIARDIDYCADLKKRFQNHAPKPKKE